MAGLAVSGKRLVVERHRWNDVGCSKANMQRDCMVADLRYRSGSPCCKTMGCTVATGFERTAEGCRLTGVEVNLEVGAAVDSLTGLDHTEPSDPEEVDSVSP